MFANPAAFWQPLESEPGPGCGRHVRLVPSLSPTPAAGRCHVSLIETTACVDHPDPAVAALPRFVEPLSPAGREALFWSLHVAFWAGVFGVLMLISQVYQPRVAEPPRRASFIGWAAR
jgi:hypothetical protein